MAVQPDDLGTLSLPFNCPIFFKLYDDYQGLVEPFLMGFFTFFFLHFCCLTVNCFEESRGEEEGVKKKRRKTEFKRKQIVW